MSAGYVSRVVSREGLTLVVRVERAHPDYAIEPDQVLEEFGVIVLAGWATNPNMVLAERLREKLPRGPEPDAPATYLEPYVRVTGTSSVGGTKLGALDITLALSEAGLFDEVEDGAEWDDQGLLDRGAKKKKAKAGKKEAPAKTAPAKKPAAKKAAKSEAAWPPPGEVTAGELITYLLQTWPDNDFQKLEASQLLRTRGRSSDADALLLSIKGEDAATRRKRDLELARHRDPETARTLATALQAEFDASVEPLPVVDWVALGLVWYGIGETALGDAALAKGQTCRGQRELAFELLINGGRAEQAAEFFRSVDAAGFGECETFERLARASWADAEALIRVLQPHKLEHDYRYLRIGTAALLAKGDFGGALAWIARFDADGVFTSARELGEDNWDRFEKRKAEERVLQAMWDNGDRQRFESTFGALLPKGRCPADAAHLLAFGARLDAAWVRPWVEESILHLEEQTMLALDRPSYLRAIGEAAMRAEIPGVFEKLIALVAWPSPTEIMRLLSLTTKLERPMFQPFARHVRETRLGLLAGLPVGDARWTPLFAQVLNDVDEPERDRIQAGERMVANLVAFAWSCGKHEESRALVARASMWTPGAAPKKKPDPVLVSRVVRAQAEAGDFDGAYQSMKLVPAAKRYFGTMSLINELVPRGMLGAVMSLMSDEKELPDTADAERRGPYALKILELLARRSPEAWVD